MEPTTLIVSALVAGATAALQDTAGQVIKDAYGALKDLLKKRFAGKPEAEVALQQAEKKPEVWKEPLKDAIVEAEADQDQAVLDAAQRLLKLVQPQQASAGKYNVQIGEAQGTVVGDNAQVTMTFGNQSKKDE